MIHSLSPCPLSPSVLWAPSNCFFSSNTESDSVLQSRMLHILQYFTRFPLSSESLFMLKSGFCHNYGFIFFQPIESNFITCFFPQKDAYKKLIRFDKHYFFWYWSDCLPLSPIHFASHCCFGRLNNAALAVEYTTLTADNDILAEESEDVSLGIIWPQFGVRV